MYSPKITQRDFDRLIARGREQVRDDFTLIRYSVEEVAEEVAHLDELYDPKTGQLARPLTAAEEAFIQNEMLLCAIDYKYWAERYVFIELDRVSGGIGRMRFWGSQQLLLDQLGQIEEEMWEDYDRQVEAGYSEDMIRVNGIMVAIPKGRQLGATTFCQSCVLHRAIFSLYIRLVTGSSNEDKTQELFEKKTLFIFNRLPWWMQPRVGYRTKDRGMSFPDIGNIILLQDGAQTKGVGQGGTTTAGHLTETGSWYQPAETLEKHFFNSIPYTTQTLLLLESTGEGEGTWWHHFVTKTPPVGSKNRGTRFRRIFIPFYAEPGKYRLMPPDGWEPSPPSKQVARRIWETSKEYLGRNVMVERDQLYWYEVHRQQAISDGRLNFFLSEYPITLEESFQATTVSPFPHHVLARHDLSCSEGKPYEYNTTRNVFRPLKEADLQANPGDERGIIWIYEKPKKNATYIIGVDGARGIPGWDRLIRQENDTKIDNTCISVWRVGERGEPDTQVAEFAAPIPSEDAAPIGNFLGRLYAGRDEEMCLQIVETWPSPGTAYQERLMNEYGYWNLFQRVNAITYATARDYGWEANSKTVQDLWVRTQRLMVYEHPKTKRVKVVIRSRYLVNEMRHCDVDPKRMTAKAEYGYHDDRVRAGQLALYAAHDWATYDPTDDVERQPERQKPDFQRSDMSVAEVAEYVNGLLDSDQWN